MGVVGDTSSGGCCCCSSWFLLLIVIPSVCCDGVLCGWTAVSATHRANNADGSRDGLRASPREDRARIDRSPRSLRVTMGVRFAHLLRGEMRGENISVVPVMADIVVHRGACACSQAR